MSSRENVTKRISYKNNDVLNKNNFDAEIYNLNESKEINFDYYNLRKKYIITQFNAIQENNIDLQTTNNNKFLKGMIKILERFITLIENLYNNFMKFMDSLHSNFISKVKSRQIDLEFIKNTNMYFTGFEFTLNNRLNTDFYTLSKLGDYQFNQDNLLSITASQVKDIERLVKNDDYYNEIRAKVINGYGYISKEEYSRELFKKFRNNSSEPKAINFNNYSTINNLFDDIQNYKIELNNVKNERDIIISSYKKMINYFNSLISVEQPKNNHELKRRVYINSRLHSEKGMKDPYKKIELSDDEKLLMTIKKYGILRATEAKNIGNIINDAYAAKLEAIKMKYKQDISILIKLSTLNLV